MTTSNLPTQKTTAEIHEWMKGLEDGQKQVFAINWKIPHTLFNIACRYYDPMTIQKVDWYSIHKSRDLGNWSHGGKVNVL